MDTKMLVILFILMLACIFIGILIMIIEIRIKRKYDNYYDKEIGIAYIIWFIIFVAVMTFLNRYCIY